MKVIKLFFSLFLLIIILLMVNSVKIPEIRFITSGTLNGTAAFVSLENINENETYLYFSFDFEFHSNAISEGKDIAYFLISSEIDFANKKKRKIKYGFLKKNWTEINDDDFHDIKWQKATFLHKEKSYDVIYYYYEINRKDDKMKTLLFRIPIKGNKKGSITIENILSFPNFNDNDKISDI